MTFKSLIFNSKFKRRRNDLFAVSYTIWSMQTWLKPGQLLEDMAKFMREILNSGLRISLVVFRKSIPV